MRLYNDKNLQLLYEEEFQKIPYIFRFGRKRAKICVIALGVLIVITLLFAFLTYHSRTLVVTFEGTNFDIYDYVYDHFFSNVLKIACGVTFLLAAWIGIASLFEKKAFKKASNFAQMIAINEKHKQEMERQNRNIGM